MSQAASQLARSRSGASPLSVREPSTRTRSAGAGGSAGGGEPSRATCTRPSRRELSVQATAREPSASSTGTIESTLRTVPPSAIASRAPPSKFSSAARGSMRQTWSVRCSWPQVSSTRPSAPSVARGLLPRASGGAPPSPNSPCSPESTVSSSRVEGHQRQVLEPVRAPERDRRAEDPRRGAGADRQRRVRQPGPRDDGAAVRPQAPPSGTPPNSSIVSAIRNG